MGKPILNKSLRTAKSGKNDEFYTQLVDIEKELMYYKHHFKNKVVFCNCDDPEESNFWSYFALNFEYLGLKKLVATHYEEDKPSYKLEIVSDTNNDGKINKLDTIRSPLKQNGDFRSPECIEILKESDIVVTNPPFSLFRDYVAQLIEYDKKFIIIGNQNNFTYKDIFKLLKENKVWAGVDNGGTKWFEVPIHYDITTETRKKVIDGRKYFSMGNIYWFTNLDIKKRHQDLILYRSYNENEYPTYDNYDAINVNKVADIPMDYMGLMGVPITFIDKYNPKQFEIIGIDRVLVEELTGKVSRFRIGGKEIYARIVIKRRK
jgi:hypothetical protein